MWLLEPVDLIDNIWRQSQLLEKINSQFPFSRKNVSNDTNMYASQLWCNFRKARMQRSWSNYNCNCNWVQLITYFQVIAIVMETLYSFVIAICNKNWTNYNYFCFQQLHRIRENAEKQNHCYTFYVTYYYTTELDRYTAWSPGLSMGMSFLWESHGKRPMGWDEMRQA